jgi:glycine betaine/proline transport system substrate-binding protein
MAVPTYMDVTSIDQLNETDAEYILGIEPSAVVTQMVADAVIPQYGLKQKLVEAPTEGMLAEVETRYNNKEEFAFLAWSPHWMNQRYDFRYLEDPKDAMGATNEPTQLSTIVNEKLQEKDPVAYAFMEALTLTEEQLNDLSRALLTRRGTRLGVPGGGCGTTTTFGSLGPRLRRMRRSLKTRAPTAVRTR